MKIKYHYKLALIITLATGAALFQQSPTEKPLTPQTKQTSTVVGNPQLLQNRYEEWKASAPQNKLEIDLMEAKQHASKIQGVLSLDLVNHELFAQLATPSSVALGLWLTQDAQLYPINQPSANVAYIGEFSEDKSGQLTLKKNISELIQQGFRIGQAVVAPTTISHLEEMKLVGSPSLFQRLYATEQWAAGKSSDLSIGNLFIPVAEAVEATGFPDVFNDLVTEGEEIFFNETFDGNGRTCGTCHPAQNNFTLDSSFIATLPANDPLFVAEYIPELMFGAPENLDSFGNPRRFENPALMRAFGLILENVDGLDDVTNRFTMRSVPHNIGMSVSVTTPPTGLTPPNDRTGWSGDGAPSGVVGGVAASGRVRDFVLGAIVQHTPKTMARSFSGPNPDFRVATISELDAVEAFLFSLGRQQELNIIAGAPNELILANASAEAGKALFRDGVPGGTRTCQGCHANAGANSLNPANPGNRNFNTGVELFLRNRIDDGNFTIVGEPRPVDGGFGTNPAGNFTSLIAQPGFVNQNFGNKTFNSVSLVEAADTPPFFHNNIIDNLEDAIAFYNSPEFLAENGGSIPFTPAEVTKVANFLRVINAIDNIENSAQRQVERALIALNQLPAPNTVLARIISIMIADTDDAIKVLKDGNLHNSGGLPVNAVKQLEKALQKMALASNASANAAARIIHLNDAKIHLQNAVSLMRIQ